MITRPYIYDEKNFKVAKSTEKNAKVMRFGTSRNSPLIVFAKPQQCEEGTCTLYTFDICCNICLLGNDVLSFYIIFYLYFIFFSEIFLIILFLVL